MTTLESRPPSPEDTADNDQKPCGHGRMLRKEDPRFIRGRGTYVDDVVLPGMLHLAILRSPYAHAKIKSIDTTAAKQSPGVVAVFTADDIPGVNDVGPIIHGDDPILTNGVVQYVGQPVFIVVAVSHDRARLAARRAEIVYEELPAVLTAQQARAAKQHVLPPMKLARGDSSAKIARAAHHDAGEMLLGGQEQFYLEGQISYAVPKDDA